MGITQNQALDCFASDDLIGIGMEAAAVRRRLHPEGVVTYALEGRLDYTKQTDTKQTDFDQQIAHLLDAGATSLILHGQPTPQHTLAWFEDLFHNIKRRTPDLWLHCLSASEILTLSRQSDLSLDSTLARLRDAGLDSIPGDDAGILDDAVQGSASRRATDWIAVHRAAHKLGIETTASMIF
ncbi:MAG: dehypoxanthine futalosine cyclase, partial [Acidobacteriota bacterium]|nr:dehypoxanthine futalosine cyclase [Acidobacteriota bacterium]